MTPTIPMSGSEWSSPYSGNPPESIKWIVDDVVSLVRGIGLAQPEPGSYAVPDRPRVVSIFGSRGTGKSTVLSFAAHALNRRNDHLVLPVIDPEAFAPGDSLAGWVLAHLERTLGTHERAQEADSETGRSLEQLLEDLRRGQAVRGSGYLPGLERRGLSFDDFARDAVKVPAHGVRTSSRLASVLDALSQARGLLDMRLVVPVDDADLFPELLPSIVTDAQMLGASSRVIVLFAADLRTLGQSLQIAFLSTHHPGATSALAHSLLEPRDVRELVARRLVKHFPRSLRIDLPTFSTDQRLSFRPLGDEAKSPLLDVLSHFSLDQAGGRTLADMFIVRSVSGDQVAVSPYTLGLSDNARDIRQLYEALVAIDPNSSHAAARALAVIIRHGLDGLESELPRRASKAITLEGDRGRPVARFDFSEVGFGKNVVGGIRLYITAGLRELPQMEDELSDGVASEDPLLRFVLARPVGRHWSILRPASEQQSDDDGDGSMLADTSQHSAPEARAEQLPDQFTHLALLAWEATQGEGASSLFEAAGYVRSPALPGGRNWSGTVEGWPTSAQWQYWTVPEWEEFSDYFVYQTGWAHLIHASEALAPAPAGPALLELFLLAHLGLISSVHSCRAVPDWIWQVNTRALSDMIESDGWADRRRELKDTVARHLVEAVTAARAGTTVRDVDFSTWFRLLLPLAATPLLTTADMSGWLIDVWKSHVPEASRVEAVDVVARFAREHITSPLADGDIELLRHIEPGTTDRAGGAQSRAQGLQNVRNEYRIRREQRRHELLSALEAANVEPAHIEALKTQGATREVLLQLIDAGLQPGSVTAIAEAFPEPPRLQPDIKSDPVEPRPL